jgi:hypothetical protein
LQESSTSAVATEKKNKEEGEESTVAVPAKKPKPAAKAAAVAKPLRQMMEEDVIPPLQAILESQDDISDIDLSFQDREWNFVVSQFLLRNSKVQFCFSLSEAQWKLISNGFGEIESMYNPLDPLPTD